jgi:uncharacterized protein (TIGR02246 family)
MLALKKMTAVEAFLEQYIAAFNARDGARIAAMYNVPCVTMRADGSIHAFTSRDEIQAFFQRLAETYYRDGCRGWHYSNLEVTPLGTRSVIATMDWEMRREDASAIRRWRQSYHLVAGDGGLRVLASTIHLQ